MTESNYSKYRGKCKKFSEELIEKNPEYTLVRGYYHCPLWGKQEHWWCVNPEGEIIDPSVKQFPSAGCGKYEVFDGIITCEQCGKRVPEAESTMMGPYPVCSDKCGMKLVGLT